MPVSVAFRTLKPSGSPESLVQPENIKAAFVTFWALKPSGSEERLEQPENMS